MIDDVWLRALVAIAVLCCGSVARADVDDDGEDDPHYIVMVGEAGLEIAIPAAYYWRTKNHQSIDWTLHWDYEGWKSKLITFERVRFDTNPFPVNAVRHPFAGFLDYQIARSNGLDVFGATAFAFLAGVAWEYFVEYREDPSINDMILNTYGGLAIGEPTHQIAQIWRGGMLSPSDRLRTALFSPADALHDLYRKHWRHHPVPHELGAFAGVETRWFDADRRDLLWIGADAEVEPAKGQAVAPGSASSIRVAARIGDDNGHARLFTTTWMSRTSLVGAQRDAGANSERVALGAGLMYRHDRLLDEWDRILAAHIVGLQTRFTHRAELTVRWDVEAYGDFALAQAYVFGPSIPFPRPPPYRSALQSDGYYDAFGGTAASRLRLDVGAWRFDGEVSVHRWWQVAGADRDPTAARVAPSSTVIPATPTGTSDWRAYARLAIDRRFQAWSVGGEVNGAYRRGMWQDLVRSGSDESIGLRITVPF